MRVYRGCQNTRWWGSSTAPPLAMGSRLLRRWLHRPLRDHTALRARYDAVAQLVENSFHSKLSQALKGIGDLERILARVALRSARPRDLTQLRGCLAALPLVRSLLSEVVSPLIQQLADAISDHTG